MKQYGKAREKRAGGNTAAGTKRLTIDIPRELHRILKVRAAEQDLTMAGMVRSLIAQWADNQRH